jgi:hypothetical protein
MSRKPLVSILLAVAAILAVRVPTADAHGDTIVPQVADGLNTDGTRFKTKFDISNLSADVSTSDESITDLRVLFFHQDGTPWSIGTNQGTGSDFTFSLYPFQTLRIETLGTGANLVSGYAIVRNLAGTSTYSDGFKVSVSVFYEISRSSGVIDTVSVPATEATNWFTVPIETDTVNNLLSGLAIVNLDTGSSNRVRLKLWEAVSPSSGPPRPDPTDTNQFVSFTLNAKEQRARFLNETGLYPNRTRVKGLLEGISDRPVAVVALLQTPSSTGVQYATLTATRRDTLRTNSFLYLKQATTLSNGRILQWGLNADGPEIDYFGQFNEGLDLLVPRWDVTYDTITTTQRQLTAQSGAQLSIIGIRNTTDFDRLSLSDLQGRTYSSSPISLNDSSANFAVNFAFAIKTNLGRYAKVRIGDIITDGADSTLRHLVLEVLTFR